MNSLKLTLLTISTAALLAAGCSSEESSPSAEAAPTGSPSASPAASPSPSPSGSPSPAEIGKKKVEVEVVASEPQASPAASVQVTDIAGHPAEKAITSLLESGAVMADSGGQFRPGEAITRREFIHWMYGFDSKGIKPRKPQKASFTDVTVSDKDFDLIEGLQGAGVVTGFPDGSMKLDKELTREELALLWGWYQSADNVVSPLIPLAAAEISYRKYSDREKVGEIFKRAVGHYSQNKLIVKAFGETPALSPQGSVTRSEAALWIATYYNELTGDEKTKFEQRRQNK
ncbi:S-layer homology domain-containing protein [Paenibacillus sp. FJAT-26967]|uniref:S-layer homology domain-containing protein n=1 Tax=Paenibacillus sp. FJAT-26967 TaxID=1729690 RepID=UPI000838CA9B|nr:S-layer homology domain-containing protein [Paenibacillus sp. FJAT-26967]